MGTTRIWFTNGTCCAAILPGMKQTPEHSALLLDENRSKQPFARRSECMGANGVSCRHPLGKVRKGESGLRGLVALDRPLTEGWARGTRECGKRILLLITLV